MSAVARFTILIVDDNFNNLFTLRTLITQHIAEVDIIEAESGSQALAQLTQQTVDLIILDIQMPEMDGFETAQMIRAVKRTQNIPIVFLTAAYKSEEFQAHGFAVGAADYLTKPIDTGQLISRIRIYLRFIGQQRQHNHELEAKVQQRTAELSEANAQLTRISQQNCSILNAAGEGILGLDAQGQVTFINPIASQLLKISSDKALDCTLHELIHATDLDFNTALEKNCSFCQTLLNGETYQVDDDVFYLQDGSRLPVKYVLVPIFEEASMTGAVLTFNDITQRKKAEQILQNAKEAAEQANQAKSCFLANMSHELRTPLNVIIGYSEIIMEDIGEEIAAVELGDSVTQDLERINHAAQHLLKLINDVLDLSKIEAGKASLENIHFAADSLVKDIVPTIFPLSQQRGNRLEVDCPPSDLYLYADMLKVKQILLNLLGNACKFTENGLIRLEVLPHTDDKQVEWVVFKVVDSGIGMSLKDQSKIFAAFSQADVSSTRKYGGTGLGLTISQQFAKLMGGFIQVSSEPQQGSTFTLYLPAASHPEASASVTTLTYCENVA